MQLLNYILKRVLQMLPVLLLVTILIFLMMRLIPGDAAEVMLGEKATPELVAALRKQMQLDQPLHIQYFTFLKNLLTFDLGRSITFRIPVTELLFKRVSVTLSLTLATFFFVFIISLPLGYIAAIKKDKLGDQIIRTGALIALATPSFWTGLLLLLLFGLYLKWLPIGGWGDTWPQHLKALILPAFTQSLSTCALIVRNLRNSIINVLTSDYVDFAKSKGLRAAVVRSRYIVRNALISTVTLFSMRLASMLGGAVIIESVFALPGVGSLLISSILGRDYPVVQANVFLFSLLIMVANLLTDILYSALDPRVRLE